ncbi:HAD family hydrolase [Halonatronum saccharophilum]|uniref:HAD family hydrolase n=1 Tax=Halonatronum saccharophilum TaxID=150060 RepID=UPI00048A1633|nr:HAD family hydrolase [Halonatronum saccharophilum]
MITINLEERDTILFDLDGTLLRVNFDHFLKDYFKGLTNEIKDILDPQIFMNALLKGTDDMAKNNGKVTNQEVFMKTFFSMVDVEDKEGMKARFDHFYRVGFKKLGQGIEADDNVVELIAYLKELGYNLALTTNPLFPKEAILERMKWAGLKEEDFDLITTYEIMHYSKPNINYYQEVLDNLGITADQAIMVGNDLQEDMVAGDLGISTFLVTDFLIDREEKEEFDTDWKGSMLEFKDYVEENF